MTLALVAGVLIFCATSGLSRSFDFAGCYSAGLIARQSGIAQVYDVPQQAKAQQSIPVGSKLFLIAYPPFQVLLFAQFARFPYAVAYVLWGLMNLALWAAFVIQMRRMLPAHDDASTLFDALFLLPPGLGGGGAGAELDDSSARLLFPLGNPSSRVGIFGRAHFSDSGC